MGILYLERIKEVYKIEKNKIPNNEMESAFNAIEKILFSEVLEKQMTDILSKTDELTDSNKVLTGKVSMLFIDIRESTKLPDKFSPDELVRIYRSYIRLIVQAVRYSGGIVRDFMGDGVLATFIDDEYSNSEDKAVYSARYMNTLLDKLLNPLLDKELFYRISYGIGIHTGEISLSKVGMKGKDPKQEEIEYGTVWIGNSTNLASKYSSAVSNSTVFISSSTYSKLSEINKTNKWNKFEIFKGNNLLNGYTINQFYLNIEEEIEPVIAQFNDKEDKSLNVFSKIYETSLSHLSSNALELGKREANLDIKEKELGTKLDEVSELEKEYKRQQKNLKEIEYKFYLEVLENSFLKADYIMAMGRSFWEKTVKNLMWIGKKLDKTEYEIKKDISVYMVDIYSTQEVWKEAYEYLLIKASTKWLNFSNVKKIIINLGYSNRLEYVIKARLESGSLSKKETQEFLEIHEWLKNK